MRLEVVLDRLQGMRLGAAAGAVAQARQAASWVHDGLQQRGSRHQVAPDAAALIVKLPVCQRESTLRAGANNAIGVISGC